MKTWCKVRRLGPANGLLQNCNTKEYKALPEASVQYLWNGLVWLLPVMCFQYLPMLRYLFLRCRPAVSATCTLLKTSCDTLPAWPVKATSESNRLWGCGDDAMWEKKNTERHSLGRAGFKLGLSHLTVASNAQQPRKVNDVLLSRQGINRVNVFGHLGPFLQTSFFPRGIFLERNKVSSSIETAWGWSNVASNSLFSESSFL